LQQPHFLLKPSNLRLGFLAPDHGPLERRVGCPALELLRLHGDAEVVELADFIVYRAVAALVAQRGHKGLAALVDAVGRGRLQRPSSGRAAGQA